MSHEAAFIIIVIDFKYDYRKLSNRQIMHLLNLLISSRIYSDFIMYKLNFLVENVNLDKGTIDHR